MEIKWALLSQEFSSAGWLILYSKEMLKISCREYVLVLLITLFLPCGISVLFRVGALLITHCILFLEVLSVTYLASIPTSLLRVAYKRFNGIIILESFIFFYVSHNYRTVAMICVTKM